METRELSAIVSTSPGDLSSGLVLKVDEKEALIKVRGVIGKLSPEDAKWAAKAIDTKSRTIKFLQKFSLPQILQPGDVVKVSIKSIRGSAVQLSLEQDPTVEGALVAIEQDTGFIRALSEAMML